MNSALICVGRLKERYWREAAAEYEKRLTRFGRFETIELPDLPEPANSSPAIERQICQREGEAILARIRADDVVIALCIEGKTCSSEELSRRMADFAVAGKTQLTFLIGGSVGLDETLKRQADWRLSMSPMTFPHHLARIMLLEQIYRAYQIEQGTKYHK